MSVIITPDEVCDTYVEIDKKYVAGSENLW